MPKSRDPYDELARELIRPEPVRVVMTGTTTPGGIDDINQNDSWTNPMSEEGDLIVGGESGGAVRKGIGNEGDVLQVLGGVVDWAPSPSGAGGQYQQLVYTTYGGGSFIWDSGGHPVYVLADLE